MAPNSSAQSLSVHEEPARWGVQEKPSSRSTCRAQVVARDAPPFSVADIRAAIPTRCFEISIVRSFSHLFHDLLFVGVAAFAATFIDSSSLPMWMRIVLWPIYWWFQGVFATGVWVLAHECGHRAFARSKLVNDVVGLILHSFLLVPYHAWRISHASHHANTNSLERDEVFVPSHSFTPRPDGQPRPLSAPFRLANLVGQMVLGWPLYLLVNATGRPYPRWANHFSPSSPIFRPSQSSLILLSDVALVLVVSLLGWWAYTTSLTTVVCYYGIPYILVHHWLVLITQLQHTTRALPHYNDTEWTWLRGALATVDRSYGSFYNHFFHHISDTHVVHHLFSRLPHYHA
mmetsp:Transcript_46417/g.119804  ORF Transcript_46417/g.119804 Transcript_46417/m.119804 type:complete len:345 (+) Transcript_46417:153-1187(+)